MSASPAGSDVYVALAGDERWRADYRGELLARVAAAGALSRPVFAHIGVYLQSLEYETTNAIKKTLLHGRLRWRSCGSSRRRTRARRCSMSWAAELRSTTPTSRPRSVTWSNATSAAARSEETLSAHGHFFARR